MAFRNPKTVAEQGGIAEKLASEAYRAMGGVARKIIANRAIVGKLKKQGINKIGRAFPWPKNCTISPFIPAKSKTGRKGTGQNMS